VHTLKRRSPPNATPIGSLSSDEARDNQERNEGKEELLTTRRGPSGSRALTGRSSENPSHRKKEHVIAKERAQKEKRTNWKKYNSRSQYQYLKGREEAEKARRDSSTQLRH